MTTTAICDGFHVCQSFLGARIHEAKDPGADLSDRLGQVVGTVFGLMETHEDVWQRVVASTHVPLFGFRFDVGLEPVTVDVGRLTARFRQGVSDLAEVWDPIFHPDDRHDLQLLASRDPESFRIPDDLWVRLLYDLACAFHRRVMDRGHLVRSILPLYMGWVASFVQDVAGKGADDVDRRIERLSEAFESQKWYLLQRWCH